MTSKEYGLERRLRQTSPQEISPHGFAREWLRFCRAPRAVVSAVNRLRGLRRLSECGVVLLRGRGQSTEPA